MKRAVLLLFALPALANAQSDSARARVSRELVATAVELAQRGKHEPQLFRDALRVYDRAIAADPANLDARVRLADLFLSKYNSADAKRTLAEVFARSPNHVPALVLEARRRSFDNERGADSVLARALQLEPEHTAGRVLRARFLADVEEFAAAHREIERALRASPDDADALAFGAALRYVAGDTSGYDAMMRRYAGLHRGEAGVHVALSELLGRVRQYAGAASVAREGTRVDASSWRAHALLGTNLLRLGDVEPARKSLEIAFEGDPYDIWTKNTLDLLDTFGEYDEIAHGPFRFVIDTAESRLLRLYLGELADRAYATFSTKYGFTPDTPIRVEVYRSHADFSVRTVGLAGLGALGVSFGNTIAFDSPAAKDGGGGSFNWASTAWHELAHTFTLGASEQRVPRWLSEGLSVYEERKARPGWGQNVTPGFLQAYADGRLLPVSRLNDGFIRPAYPGQVLFSYYQASLVCEFIAREWGEPALVSMVQAYRSGIATQDVVRRVLRIDMRTLDRRFDDYMRARFGPMLATLRDYPRQVAAARALLQRGDTAAALPILERARSLFPEFGGAESAYPLLVRAMMSRGDRKGAADVLSAMVSLGDVPHEMHVGLANLLLQIGDTARAADALEGAMYVNPYNVAEHELLAGLYAGLGDRPKAIRERLAVVALNPVDRAEALYQLAVAYRDAGDTPNARRSVLRSLEEAPHFERAQELLLAIHEARTP